MRKLTYNPDRPPRRKRGWTATERIERKRCLGVLTMLRREIRQERKEQRRQKDERRTQPVSLSPAAASSHPR